MSKRLLVCLCPSGKAAFGQTLEDVHEFGTTVDVEAETVEEAMAIIRARFPDAVRSRAWKGYPDMERVEQWDRAALVVWPSQEAMEVDIRETEYLRDMPLRSCAIVMNCRTEEEPEQRAQMWEVVDSEELN